MAVELVGGQAPPNEPENKIALLAHGLAGVGKSGLALSFPEPFWYYNLDRPIGHFMKVMPETRHVSYEAATMDVDATTPGMAQQYLNKFDALVKAAVASKSNGTFVVDGWDIFWDLVKIAKVKNLDDSTVSKEYAPANEYMNNHLRRLGLSNLNIVFTAFSKQKWTGMKTETTLMLPEGYKHKERWLTHEVYMFTPENKHEPDIKPTGLVGGQSHSSYISRSKLNEKLIGTVVPSLTFGMLYKLTFGKGYPEPERLWSPARASLQEVAQ